MKILSYKVSINTYCTVFIICLLLALLQSRPELRDLMNLLAPVAPKYPQIGTALNVPMNELGLTHLADFHKDNLQCTLQWWLDNGDSPHINSPVTWGNIISVIEGNLVQNFDHAQKMRSFLRGKLLCSSFITLLF